MARPGSGRRVRGARARRGERGHAHRGGDALRRVRVARREAAREDRRGERRRRRLSPAARRGPLRCARHPARRPARSPRAGRLPRRPLLRARRGGGDRVGAPDPHPGPRDLGRLRDAGHAPQHRPPPERSGRPPRRHGPRLRAALPVARDAAHRPGALLAGKGLLHRRARCAPRPAPHHGRPGRPRPLDRLPRERVRHGVRRRRDLVRLGGDVRDPARRRPLPRAGRAPAGHRDHPRPRALRAARRHPGTPGRGTTRRTARPSTSGFRPRRCVAATGCGCARARSSPPTG